VAECFLNKILSQQRNTAQRLSSAFGEKIRLSLKVHVLCFGSLMSLEGSNGSEHVGSFNYGLIFSLSCSFLCPSHMIVSI
jgi:hypothetical protein